MLQGGENQYEVIELTESRRHRPWRAISETGAELFFGTCGSRGVGGNGDDQRPTSLHPAPPSGWMHGKDNLQTAPDFLKNREQQSQQVQDDRNHGGQAQKMKTEECNDKGDREIPPPPS
ncbi:hypothetical protein V3C99_018718 [Haemonchus contortus]